MVFSGIRTLALPSSCHDIMAKEAWKNLMDLPQPNGE